MHGSKRAFSLVEALLVAALVSLLLALLVPVLSEAREVSRRSVCGSNMRQWYGIHEAYANDFSGTYPGRKMWDLAMKNYQPNYAPNDASRTSNPPLFPIIHDVSIFKLPAYGWTLRLRRCPSRIFSRPAEINAAFDRYTGPGYYSYWMKTDYTTFWGRGSRSDYASTYGWLYAGTRIAQNMGPVPNKKVNRKAGTPLMMDHSYTREFNGAYTGYGGTDGGWGSNHLDGSASTRRLAAGSNLLRYDGSCKFVDMRVTTVSYLNDYYEHAPIPPAELP